MSAVVLQIIIAVQSSLITIPINVIIGFIFRSARMRPSEKQSIADKVDEGMQVCLLAGKNLAKLLCV